MSSISVGSLREILKDIPDDCEVIMQIKHRYPISKEKGEKGWIAYINGIEFRPERKEVYLKN